MRWVRFAVLVVVVAVLQAGFLDRFAVTSSNIKPDLLLVLMVFFAVESIPAGRTPRRPSYQAELSFAIISSFVIGFVADVATVGAVPGSRMISFGLTGTTIAYARRTIAVRRMAYQALVVLAAGIVAGLLTGFLSRLRGRPGAGFGFVFFQSVYSAVAAPFLFLLSRWWMRIRRRRFSRY